MRENNSFTRSIRKALFRMVAEPLGKKWPILHEIWPKNGLESRDPRGGLKKEPNYRPALKPKMRKNIKKMGESRRQSDKIKINAIGKRK